MNGLSGWIEQQQREYRRKLSAWERASVVISYDKNRVRKDAYGSFIVWSEYGQKTTYGWEIDHELPKAHFPDLATVPANLRALHWRNNRTKADGVDIATLSKLLGGNR